MFWIGTPGKILVFIAAALTLILGWGRAAFAADPPDLDPPQAEMVAPAPDSTVREARPWIIINVRDEGSGLDLSRIRLAFDRFDVTQSATVDAVDDTEAAVRYRPPAALAPGPHEVWFQAADTRGNLQVVTWRFTIEAAAPYAAVTDLGGDLSLGGSVLPLQQVTTTLDLACDLRLEPAAGVENRPVSIRAAMQIAGATDMVGPGQWFGGYTIDLRQYALSIEAGRTTAALGAILIEFPSRTLLPQAVQNGAFLDWQGSGWDLAGFKGESASTYGLSLTLVDFSGFSCRYAGDNNWQVRAVAGRTESAGYSAHVYTLGAAIPLTSRLILALEGVASEGEDGLFGRAISFGVNGRGTALYWDLSYWEAGADLAVPMLLPNLPVGGGSRKLGFKLTANLGGSCTAVCDMASTRLNLEEVEAQAEDADTARISLHFRSEGAWSYSIDCTASDYRPSPGALGVPETMQQISGTIDYLGSGGLVTAEVRTAFTWSDGEIVGNGFYLTVNRSLTAGALKGRAERAFSRQPLLDRDTETTALRLAWQPDLTLDLFDPAPGLTGEIALALNREVRRTASTGMVKADEITYKLSTGLTLKLSPDETLVLTAAYLWADPPGRKLGLEYRRSF